MMGENFKEMKMHWGNPAALGLFGLSISALAAASDKLGLAVMEPSLMPWVFFLGGLALIIAAIFELKCGDTFAATFFGAFGVFWLAYGNPWWEVSAGWEDLGIIIIGYLIFSLYMMYAAATIDKVKFFVLFFAALMFAGLVANVYWGATLKFAGIAELFLAMTGFYASAAILMKSMAGFDVLPVGKPLLEFKEIKL
ncbi:MAG: acetate uptake transporter [Thermoplasmata archaeon]|nr:acetate uptake transporter [Thermoplasmata archaeon]